MKAMITLLTILFAAQSHASMIEIAGKCEEKVVAKAEEAITAEDAGGVTDISASVYPNVFVATYNFSECYGSVSVKIQPTKIEKGLNGENVATDCKVLSAKDDEQPNCG